MSHFEQRVALVTGAAGLIGRGICHLLSQSGMAVVLADLRADELADLVQVLQAGGPSLAVRTDVGDETSAAAAIQAALNRFGRIDLLVNNAATAAPGREDPEQLALTDWDKVLRTNLTGPFLMAKHAIPHLRSTRGSIINIASTRALQSEPRTEAYTASKGGLVALTHALALSLGPEIRVNCISPGWIAADSTPLATELRPEDHAQHPVGRVGSVADIAAMVAYLASDKAGFITGQNLIIDGGMTRKMIYSD